MRGHICAATHARPAQPALLALLACSLSTLGGAPISMELEVPDGVIADDAPLAANEPPGRSLGGRLRSMAEDFIPTAIIDKVAEVRKPPTVQNEQTKVPDDGSTSTSPRHAAQLRLSAYTAQAAQRRVCRQVHSRLVVIANPRLRRPDGCTDQIGLPDVDGMNPLYRCAFDRKKCFQYDPDPVEGEETRYCEGNVRATANTCPSLSSRPTRAHPATAVALHPARLRWPLLTVAGAPAAAELADILQLC